MRGRVPVSSFRALARLAAGLVLVMAAATPTWAASPPPGPPFPAPEENRAVYDYAGVFRPETVAQVESIIDEIEARTGAEIAVYTQVLNYSPSTAQAEGHALALLNQWGVGRKGFDDGMVILFDLDATKVHGQVQLYAAEGYRATYLSNSERQALYEEEMLPFLRSGDLDAALLVAMARINQNATEQHAATLNIARQIDALIGLILAPVLFLLIVGWAVFNWLRFGKDPVYLDDPSIHMPAPPEKLTAAAGAAVMDGGSSRRALTTAMLDLASRGLLSFREETKLLGLGGTKVGIDINPPRADDVTEARRALNSRKPFGPAEQYALTQLSALAPSGYLDPDDVPKFGPSTTGFDSRLETEVVRNKWMTETPSKASNRWRVRGLAALVGGILVLVAGATLPSQGLVLLGIAGAAGGVVLFIIAGWMPSVTMSGAMIRAMLHAYRRTLHKTMAMARSMQQVVDEAGLPWLETPDQAVVWGTALGLQSDIEAVLARSLEDIQEGRSAASSTYFPVWYTNNSGQSFAGLAGSGGGGGLFSSSPIPDIGGMMSALGSIGNSPRSSGSGGSGGGGFSGGSSGGGGGSGGGF